MAKDGPGYVYVLKKHGEARIKVGHGIKVDRRLKQLQTGNDVKLLIYAIKFYTDRIKAESAIHNVLSAYRTTYNRKNEWFKLTPDSQHLIDIIFGKKQATAIELQRLQRLQLL
jgi:hypothetical protein